MQVRGGRYFLHEHPAQATSVTPSGNRVLCAVPAPVRSHSQYVPIQIDYPRPRPDGRAAASGEAYEMANKLALTCRDSGANLPA